MSRVCWFVRCQCLKYATVASLVYVIYSLLREFLGTQPDLKHDELAECVEQFNKSDPMTTHNGRWLSQTEPFHLHVYTAFYDNRPTLKWEPQVAVIAVLDKQQNQIWCNVYYDAGRQITGDRLSHRCLLVSLKNT